MLLICLCNLHSQELTNSQRKSFSAVEYNLKYAVQYSKWGSPYYRNQSKIYKEKALDAFCLLKKDIPNHPKFKQLEIRVGKALDTYFLQKFVNPLSRKLKRAENWYSLAILEKKIKQSQKYLEEIARLVHELKKYKDRPSGKKAYQTWKKWLDRHPIAQKKTFYFTATQRKYIKIIEHNLYYAKRYAQWRHSGYYIGQTKIAIERIAKNLDLLKKELPAHPKTKSLELQLQEVRELRVAMIIKPFLLRLKIRRQWYETNIGQGNKVGAKRNLEEIKVYVQKLSKFTYTKNGKKAYQTWKTWLKTHR